jgi:hypothetical protein
MANYGEVIEQTPVAPAPSLALLAFAGAPWHRRHRYTIVLATASVLIVAAFFLGRLQVARLPTPVAVDMTPPPAPKPAPETILLSVTVFPAHAQISVDGELVPTNPFVTRLPRSASGHRVRATAAGYQAKEREVPFIDSVVMDLSLAPLPAGERPRRGASRPHAAPPLAQSMPTPPIDVTPEPTKARPLETVDPYAPDKTSK